MATKTRKPARTLTTLAVLTVMGVLILTLGHFTQGATFTPKLALDLEGGTQLILTPRLQEGADARDVSQDDMSEAIRIIRQRIDASGVSEAEISTLGSDNIVVAIPGEADEEILSLVRSSATMRFRPVLLVGSPLPFSESAQSGSQSGSQSGQVVTLDQAVAQLAALAESDESDQNSSSYSWITPEIARDFLTLDCTDPESLTRGDLDDPSKASVACQADQSQKFLLGPVDVDGTDLKSATAGPEMTSAGRPTGKYAINLAFDSKGTEQFTKVSQRLLDFDKTDPSRNQFAVVLDGNVLLAPRMNALITDGNAQVTGTFTAREAQALANQLQFGSLPLNFEVQSEQQISATLGSNHLEKGLWAGLIGLALVVLYMIWQYRGLALLSAGSLLVAGALVYLVITLLSWAMGYRLSLPGVAGLIVAVGITADSFIVYFERIRDEVRDGRPLGVAVEEGWDRAKRTILISDAVNLTAAIVLYVLAVGGVQGFAFTLGVTTVVDLFVVFMFTHPMMELLIRTRFFGSGNRLSGLDPEHLGADSAFVYEGRGKVRHSKTAAVAASSGAAASEGLSLAERRRKARLEAAQATSAADGEVLVEVLVDEPSSDEAGKDGEADRG